jgi:hypothetical protein
LATLPSWLWNFSKIKYLALADRELRYLKLLSVRQILGLNNAGDLNCSRSKVLELPATVSTWDSAKSDKHRERDGQTGHAEDSWQEKSRQILRSVAPPNSTTGAPFKKSI